MSSAVAHALPPSILALFAPRAPIAYKPPMTKNAPFADNHSKLKYTAISKYVSEFEDPTETPPPTLVPTLEEQKEQRRAARDAAVAAKREAKEGAKVDFDPANDPKIKGDPYKTLFVSRISYETTEVQLKKDFEQYGPIKRIRLVYDTETAKPRGYAFLEYEHERDMKTAYKQGDGKKIAGRRVLVDVERGRTVRNWKPRR